MRPAVNITLPILLLAAACGGPGEAWVEPHPERLALTVTDSLQVPDSLLIGSVSDALLLEDGSMVILDMPGCRLLVFGPDGTFLRTVGRSGSGPGEFSMPAYMALLDDGNLIVADMTASSMTLFDDQWNCIEVRRGWGPIVPILLSGASEGTYTALLCEMEVDGGALSVRRRVGRFGADPEPEVVYLDQVAPVDMADPSSLYREILFAVVLAADREGRVFTSNRSGENWTVHGSYAGGEQIMELSLAIPPVLKTEAELQDEIAWMAAYAAATDDGFLLEWEPDPLRPMVEELGVDGEGNLWVKRGTEVHPVFDVFDRAGDHVATAELDLPGTASWTFRFGGNRVLAWPVDPENGEQGIYLLDLPEL